MTLPGNITLEEETARMIRVNHAGEYGAQRIYAGQLAVLKHAASRPVLEHMAAQEQAHLEAFSALMIKRRVRPTLFSPLWHVAGFALGVASAMLGEKAAMACTVAVESVIDEHYAAQEEKLENHDTELKNLITQFRAEEQEHHDTALAHGAEEAVAYPLLSAIVKAQTRLAIWLSTSL